MNRKVKIIIDKKYRIYIFRHPFIEQWKILYAAVILAELDNKKDKKLRKATRLQNFIVNFSTVCV